MRIAASLLLVSLAGAALAQRSAPSANCTQVNGKTQFDVDRALDFCARGIGKSLNVQGVIANDSLLALKISRPVADLMRADRLTAEQLVRAEGRKRPVRRSSSR